MKKNIAVVLAAGLGKRANTMIPKQFSLLSGKPMLAYSLEVFQNHPSIDGILIIIPESFLLNIDQYIDLKPYSKIIDCIVGGIERYESSLSAIQYFNNQHVNLLIHDAARPFITEDLVSGLISALDTYAAVCPAVLCKDTCFRTQDDKYIQSYISRQGMYAAQTPQAFDLNTLREAFALALQDPNSAFTDDCSVVFQYIPHTLIRIVQGSHFNFKVTYSEDFVLAEALLQMKKSK